MIKPWTIAILGLSITSSWGNGHATTYRGLVRELTARGHRVVFLERDVPWYRNNRDLPDPPYGETVLYESAEALFARHGALLAGADVAILGSYVPDGAWIGERLLKMRSGITAFYDIDTPVTLTALADGADEHLARELIPRFDLYISFTGGGVLHRLEHEFGARRARPLYCSADPDQYFPETQEVRWDLGYLGTYAADRQPSLERLCLAPAAQWPEGRFVVAGPCYPDTIVWPGNVERIHHLPPSAHRAFYNGQRFALNITRADMVTSGHAPSVRLFEAAACATPVISDWWAGLDAFFTPGDEILVSRDSADTLAILKDLTEAERIRIGNNARARVLAEHTARHRARELEIYLRECFAPPCAVNAP